MTLSREVDGEVADLAGPAEFEVVPLELATFAAKDREAVLAFEHEVARLSRAVRGAQRAAGEAEARLRHIRAAIARTPSVDLALDQEARALQQRLRELLVRLSGDPLLPRLSEPTPPSIGSRVRSVLRSQSSVTSPPTRTQRDAYGYAADAFEKLLPALRALIEDDLTALEEKLESLGAPWTPGRVPRWKK